MKIREIKQKRKTLRRKELHLSPPLKKMKGVPKRSVRDDEDVAFLAKKLSKFMRKNYRRIR